MKICFIAGANSIHSKKWIEYFADRGHQVHWISLTPDRCGVNDAVSFYRMKRARPGAADFLVQAIRVRRLIKNIHPDILHAHYAKLNGAIAALSGFHPLVVTAWGSDVLIAPKFFTKRLFVKLSLKSADLLTCDADHVRYAMIRLGASPAAIHIVRFGIDTEIFRPGESDRELQGKLGVVSAPVVLSLRNLEPVYDVETLIRAVPLILMDVPRAVCVIVGKGSEENRLKALARKVGVARSVRFVGFLKNEDVARYVRLADVYVSTSLSDAGIAASTAEAMACEIPVVVTDSGENTKWIEHGRDGFIVPVQRPDLLAQSVVALLQNEDLRKGFGKRGREIIRHRDDYYEEMAKMETLYKDLFWHKKLATP